MPGLVVRYNPLNYIIVDHQGRRRRRKQNNNNNKECKNRKENWFLRQAICFHWTIMIWIWISLPWPSPSLINGWSRLIVWVSCRRPRELNGSRVESFDQDSSRRDMGRIVSRGCKARSIVPNRSTETSLPGGGGGAGGDEEDDDPRFHISIHFKKILHFLFHEIVARSKELHDDNDGHVVDNLSLWCPLLSILWRCFVLQLWLRTTIRESRLYRIEDLAGSRPLFMKTM